jgi:MFS family permease
VIGGVISQHVHWGWIFLINVPIGVVTFAISLPFIAESRAREGARSLDIPGLVTSAIALFALTYALIEGHDRGWTSPVIVAAFALSAVALAAFLAIESRSEQPMVPLSLFRSREFSGGISTMMIWAFGIFGIYFFTSLYLQSTLGFSPTKAGLAFVPMALAIALSATLAPRVAALIGGHRTVSLGVLLMVVGLVLFARLGGGVGYGSLMPGFLLFGLGGGLMNVPLTNSVMEAAPAEHGGMAGALLNASREVAGLLGVTVVGAVLRSRQSVAFRGGASPRDAFLDGYHTGLWLTIALLATGVVLSYVTLRPRPQQRHDLGEAGQAPAAGAASQVPEVVPAVAVDASALHGSRDS